MEQIKKFISDLELFYPYKGTEENKIRIFESYAENLEGICNDSNCSYDWGKILIAIQRNYKKRDFPLLSDIINFLPHGKIDEPYQECKGEGSLLVVTLPSGQVYPFTVSGTGRSKDVVISDIKKKYGICDIKVYPKGSILIGNKVMEGG